MKKDKNQNDAWIWAMIVFATLALALLPWKGHSQALGTEAKRPSPSRDTIPGSHTGYFQGQTLVYTCYHPKVHGPAWRLKVVPAQPVAVKILPQKVNRKEK